MQAQNDNKLLDSIIFREDDLLDCGQDDQTQKDDQDSAVGAESDQVCDEDDCPEEHSEWIVQETSKEKFVSGDTLHKD